MPEAPFQNREIKEMFNDLQKGQERLRLLSVISGMALYTKTNPISNFSLVCSAFICPVYSMASLDNSTKLTFRGFTEFFCYPMMKSRITDLVALPPKVSLATVSMFFTKRGFSVMNLITAVKTSWEAAFPFMGIGTFHPRSWFSFIPCWFAFLRLEIAFRRTIFTTSSSHPRWLTEETLFTYATHQFDAIKNSHILKYLLSLTNGQVYA